MHTVHDFFDSVITIPDSCLRQLSSSDIQQRIYTSAWNNVKGDEGLVKKMSEYLFSCEVSRTVCMKNMILAELWQDLVDMIMILYLYDKSMLWSSG